MKKITKIFLSAAIIFSLFFISWTAVRIVKAVTFEFECEAYIKRATNASTVEMAKTELAKAIEYAERNNLTEGIVSIFLKNPRNDISFWYNNMTAAYNELDALPEDSTPLEKTNVLMKLRESLADNSGDGGATVLLPAGISIYPDNVLYFWWCMISLFGLGVFWSLFAVSLYNHKHRSKNITGIFDGRK